MEKDREPAVDAIATWFSTMLDNVGALTSQSSQIAGLGLCILQFLTKTSFRFLPYPGLPFGIALGLFKVTVLPLYSAIHLSCNL